MNKNNNDLFYVCSLIEFVGRRTKNRRSTVAERIGIERLKRLYEYADVFHCEPIEKTAGELIDECKITEENYDNVAACMYEPPDYWTLGEVFERLIEDCFPEGEEVKGIWEVYHSWIEERLSDYNTDLYYQPRDYIAACYRQSAVT